MTAHSRLAPSLVDSIRKALTSNALARRDRAVLRRESRARGRRIPRLGRGHSAQWGELALTSSRAAARPGDRRMRIAIVNDDMPFLVDSVANAIASRQLTIHRLLHPVVCVERDEDGVPQGRRGLLPRPQPPRIDDVCRARPRRLPRPAGACRATFAGCSATFALRFATGPSCRSGCAPTPRRSTTPKAAALLEWFADGAMTLLGFHVEQPGPAHPRRSGSSACPAHRPTRAAASMP